MSSASAAPADKFQPAWIRSAFHGPGNGGSLTNSPRVSTTEEEPVRSIYLTIKIL